MKHRLATSMLMLAIVPAVIPTQVITNTSAHSSSRDRAPAVVHPPHSEPTQDQPEQATTPNRSIQSSQHSSSNTQAESGKDKLNQSYPAYCEFYLSNVEPGSWQFQQDIQRCLYGQ